MVGGQLLVGVGVVGAGLLYIQQSSAEAAAPATPTSAPFLLWLSIGGVIVIGFALIVQAWRLRRANE